MSNNYGRIMFIPLVCSLLWLTPSARGAEDAEQTGINVEESLMSAVSNLAVRPRKFTWPTPGRILGTAIAMEGGNSAPDDGQLWNAEVLACKSEFHPNLAYIPINLEKPDEPIGPFYKYDMHIYAHPNFPNKYALEILDSNCSPNGPTYTARMLMLDVEKPGRMLVFLTTRYGELVRAALQTNDHATGLQAKEVDTSKGSEAEKRFRSLVKIVLSDKNVLAYARQKRTTTKDGTRTPR